jgi:hypothetical protein
LEINTPHLMPQSAATQIVYFLDVVLNWTMLPHQNLRKSPPINNICCADECCNSIQSQILSFADDPISGQSATTTCPATPLTAPPLGVPPAPTPRTTDHRPPTTGHQPRWLFVSL